MRIALGVTCPLYDTDINKILPHLPPRLINQCLKEIFIYLLNDIQVVICMEYSHNIDKSSWNVLLNLAGITSRALMIYNVGPVDEILSHSSPAKKKVKKEAFIMTVKNFSAERLHVIYKRLLQLESTILVRMYNYTVTDVDDLLRSALNRSCPNSLALMVHRLSGGDPFWCREMALFIKSTGMFVNVGYAIKFYGYILFI